MEFNRYEYRDKILLIRNQEPLTWQEMCERIGISMFTLKKFLKSDADLRHIVQVKIKCWVDKKLQGS